MPITTTLMVLWMLSILKTSPITTTAYSISPLVIRKRTNHCFLQQQQQQRYPTVGSVSFDTVVRSYSIQQHHLPNTYGRQITCLGMVSCYYNSGAAAHDHHQQQHSIKPVHHPPLKQHQQLHDDNYYGMPWRTSIAPYHHPPEQTSPPTLLFMPYWEHTVRTLQSRLTNLQTDHTVSPRLAYASTVSPPVSPHHTMSGSATTILTDTHISTPTTRRSTLSNTPKKRRIVSRSYTSHEYRKIRTTYYDGGDAIQVFNALFYPDPKRGNLPLLGMDLLAFGRKTYLVVIDLQPLPPVPPSTATVTATAATSSSSPSSSWNKKEKKKNDDEIQTMLIDDEVTKQVKEEWEKGRILGAQLSKTLHRDLPDVFKGKMSDRFFDKSMFFSEHVLFGRFGNALETLIYPPSSTTTSTSSGDDDLRGSSAASSSTGVGIGGDDDGGTEREGVLFDAFCEYLDKHIDMVQSAYPLSPPPSSSSSSSSSSTLSDEKSNTVASVMERSVLEGHRLYDEYSVARDPAHAMFERVFGTDWADGYLHDYLFDLSERNGEGKGGGGSGGPMP